MDRQRKRKPTTLTYLTFHPYSSSMQLDELLGQGQTKSGPLALVLVIGAHLPELLENPELVLWGDPDARVNDRDL
jgi:hypothetical protein